MILIWVRHWGYLRYASEMSGFPRSSWKEETMDLSSHNIVTGVVARPAKRHLCRERPQPIIPMDSKSSQLHYVHPQQRNVRSHVRTLSGGLAAIASIRA
uniref:Secreted protein n=1 Tax=Steinernema glaseri TaxID=37863 RepID=A0A1I7YGA7_9BILA